MLCFVVIGIRLCSKLTCLEGAIYCFNYVDQIYATLRNSTTYESLGRVGWHQLVTIFNEDRSEKLMNPRRLLQIQDSDLLYQFRRVLYLSPYGRSTFCRLVGC